MFYIEKKDVSNHMSSPSRIKPRTIKLAFPWFSIKHAAIKSKNKD